MSTSIDHTINLIATILCVDQSKLIIPPTICILLHVTDIICLCLLVDSSDRGQTDEEKSLRAQLEALQKDLDYIDFYPKGVKYISLFPSKTFNSTVSIDQSKDMSDDESDNANESNSDSDAEMKSSSKSTDESNSHSASDPKLTREEIRNLVAKAKSRVVKNDKKAEIAHSNAGKKKEKKRKEFKDPFFLHSDDEQVTNQSSLSDKKINKQSNSQSNSQSNQQASKPKLDDPFLSLADDNEQSTTQATEERPVYTSRKDRRAAERNQSITQSTIPAAKPETKPVDIKALSSVDKQALNREADRQRKRPRDDQSSDKQSSDQPKPKRFVIDPTNQSINQSNEQSSERPERTGDRAARRAERARQHALKKESGQTNSESAKPAKIQSTASVQTNDQVSTQPLSRKDRRRLASEQPAAESTVKSNEQPITQSNSQPSEPERETRKQKRARLAKDPSATDAPSNESTSQSNQSKVDVGSLLQLNEDSD